MNNKPTWTVKFHNDMGHLMCSDYDKIPEQIRTFAFEKIKNKINYATDNKNYGARYFILRAGLDNQWTYNLSNSIVTLDFSELDKFDSKTMIYI